MIQTTTDVTCDYIGCTETAKTIEPTSGSSMPRIPRGWAQAYNDSYSHRGNLCPRHTLDVFGWEVSENE